MSNRLTLLSFVTILIATTVMGSCTKPFRGPKAELRGVVLGVYAHHDESYVRKNISELKRLGANSILVKVTEVQNAWDSSVIRPDPHLTLSMKMLRFILKEARGKGLSVTLMPIVLLKNPRVSTDWRGMIIPRDRTRWFQSYRSMLLKYAQIGAEHDVAVLCVGSELVSMERYTVFWGKLIQDTRKRFSGKLVYSSNWDHLSASPAWKALDLIGLNAYYELAERSETPNAGSIRTRWERILETVRQWREELNKDLVIMEVGYPSRAGGLVDPWDHTRVDRVDLEVQRLGYEGFLREWRNESNLHGIYFYEWSGAGGASDSGYTPRGKPALKLLRRWMRDF